MSDNTDFLRTGDRTFRLRADVFLLMMKGAGYAAIFCIAIGITAAIVMGISGILPEDSKQAPDPTPFSALQPVEHIFTA